MSIVILKWNPGFSSYTMAQFLNDLEKRALSNDPLGMNWSIWDADKVKTGDTCFMLKVGYGQTGIVARGMITSDPYSGEDWAWRNRSTKYCDFDFEVMVNPDAYPLLTSSELKEAISDFDWFGGHSGLVLTDPQAKKLEHLWNDYMHNQASYFEKASDQNLFILTSSISTEGIPYSLTIERNWEDNYVINIKGRDGEITTKITISNYFRVLGKFGVKSWRALQRLLFEKYPAIDDLKQLCADLFHAQIEFQTSFYHCSDNDDDD